MLPVLALVLLAVAAALPIGIVLAAAALAAPRQRARQVLLLAVIAQVLAAGIGVLLPVLPGIVLSLASRSLGAGLLCVLLAAMLVLRGRDGTDSAAFTGAAGAVLVGAGGMLDLVTAVVGLVADGPMLRLLIGLGLLVAAAVDILLAAALVGLARRRRRGTAVVCAAAALCAVLLLLELALRWLHDIEPVVPMMPSSVVTGMSVLAVVVALVLSATGRVRSGAELD